MSAAATPTNRSKPIQEKWGDAIADGFVVLPSALLRYQNKLGIDASELVVLANLLMSWWAPGDMPFPRTATIANRMDVTPRTVQRLLKQLEEKGYVRAVRERSRRPDQPVRTKYDLSGIVAELKRLGCVDRVDKSPVTAPRPDYAQLSTETPLAYPRPSTIASVNGEHDDA